MPEVRPTAAGQALPIVRDHRRSFADNLYTYPVISRRSKGVSLGVNLNPDTICNFDCIYCQVDRVTPPRVKEVSLPTLLTELNELLDCVLTGELFTLERFQQTPPEYRRLNDIAFSGDGEPTTCTQFYEVVQAVVELKKKRHLPAVKLVLITNATRFHVPRVQAALRLLDQNQGEIWAKLDAGTEAYYHTVERTTIPFTKVLANLTQAARARPIVLQSMFLKLKGEPPTAAEQAAYCDRVNEIVQAGGKIKLVQIYTVARLPAETYVTALRASEVDALVELVRTKTGLAVEGYYGSE